MPNMIVPPGGHAGFSQMTPASRVALFPGQRSRGASRKRSGTSRRRRSTSTRKRGSSKSGRKLKFGSPAWQKKYGVGRFAKKRK